MKPLSEPFNWLEECPRNPLQRVCFFCQSDSKIIFDGLTLTISHWLQCCCTSSLWFICPLVVLFAGNFHFVWQNSTIMSNEWSAVHIYVGCAVKQYKLFEWVWPSVTISVNRRWPRRRKYLAWVFALCCSALYTNIDSELLLPFIFKSNEQTKTLKLPFPAVVLEIVLDFLYTGEARRVEGKDSLLHVSPTM